MKFQLVYNKFKFLSSFSFFLQDIVVRMVAGSLCTVV